MRIGFTTGSAVSAATKAAILRIAGRKHITEVEIPLPDGSRMKIPVSKTGLFQKKKAVAEVIKDAGDDPDVTDGARIVAFVSISRKYQADSRITIRAGKGVGVVTKPGLPVAIGEPAINPVPRRQIEQSAIEALKETGLYPADVEITVEVPDGERIAKKTLNPKLGIIGGISILGTRGTVIPFSNEAYKKTIEIEMDVAVSNGQDTIVLSTGGRSERFAKKIFKELNEVCFIQVADFFGFSLREARKRGFRHIIYSCFFGKLVKMAQGHEYTHAKASRIDFDILSRWCALFGISSESIRQIRHANTASQALEIIMKEKRADEIISFIIKKAISYARRFSGSKPDITFCLFDMKGRLLLSEKSKADER